MQALWQGLRYGAQMSLKKLKLCFTLSAIITLVLGIGANTAVFSLANATLRNPLPDAQAKQPVKMEARQQAPDFVKLGSRESAQPVSQSPPALTTEDVAAFFDDLLPQQLQRADIAGAVVAVVKDGRVLFAKGYGYADVAAKRPVSADATLFRVASISKLFTWTAVMQLIEQGKLDLDRDVNQYLHPGLRSIRISFIHK